MTEKEMQDFVVLAAKTRLAQKAYYRDRSGANLREAKRLEAELDRAVLALLPGESGAKQGGLFAESPAGGENRDRY